MYNHVTSNSLSLKQPHIYFSENGYLERGGGGSLRSQLSRTFPALVLTRRAVESSDPDITRAPSAWAARQLTGPPWRGDMEQVVVHSLRFHTLTPPSSYPQHTCLPLGRGERRCKSVNIDPLNFPSTCIHTTYN